jgi:hypothetical protein
MAELGTVIANTGCNIRMSMTNHDQMQYTSTFRVGTPLQESQEAIFDTGSTDAVILGNPLAGHNAYNSNSSSTSLVPASDEMREIVYGSATALGTDGFDRIKVGNGYTPSDQEMLIEEGTTDVGGMFYMASFDAVIGVGIDSKLDSGRPSLLKNLGCTSVEVKMSHTLGAQGGEMSFLGSAELPGYTYTEVTQDTGYWNIPFEGVSLGNTSFGANESGPALFDTGTSLIYLPKSLVAALHEQIGNFTCNNIDSLPDVTFRFGGKDWSLPPSDYIMAGLHETDTVAATHSAATTGRVSFVERPKPISFDMCDTIFQETEIMTQDGPLSIFGMAFLRAYDAHFIRASGNGAPKIGLKEGHSITVNAVDTNRGQLQPVDIKSQRQPHQQPLRADMSRAILPFRAGLVPHVGLSDEIDGASAVHATRHGHRAARSKDARPPAAIIAAGKEHYARTGEQFDYWVSLRRV